jgi:signal transduction histidine kinase
LLLGGIYFSVFEVNKARKQLDADVAQLKFLSSQLSITEERERHRIATRLHDHIGQSLVSSKFKLDELQHSVSSKEVAKALHEVCNNIARIIKVIKTLTFELSPPILNEIGFEKAVNSWLEEEIQRKHGITTEFEDDGQSKPLDVDVRAILFRNVRELLLNVVKHTKAGKVKVSVCRDDEDVRVCIEDDGVGFDPVEIKSNSIINRKFDLFSIQEGLEQMGGRFEIDSRPCEGSRIMMMVPLKIYKIKQWSTW